MVYIYRSIAWDFINMIGLQIQKFIYEVFHVTTAGFDW